MSASEGNEAAGPASANVTGEGTAAVLIDLALRVEQASGADRLLDAEIAARLCGGSVDVVGRYWKPGVRGFCVARAYCSSIDAAMTLPPWEWLAEWGFFFALEQDDFDRSKWTARADTRGDECGHGDTILSAPCSDKERAVTAFALRALAASMKDGTHVGN